MFDATAATSADAATLLFGWTAIGRTIYERIQTFRYRTYGKKVIQ
jgi:hypothetical protein